ncbi:lipid-A-disaccharide synthase [Maridesulfovibrio hydrothermalis]|uniref:Lipid-A-disaccharide synthase n=1 Tax=Maridesulfovibrio hydrothermalis AM13 = DSM 14728 TaxID=1121451 RepID=L0RCN2_9BACT|nr:lipid-A-disaccharide synthase [Maridesulfovibrio hydrothermalis]CCO23940.1 Lipid-A-disaccharide synthase [Maridesulfovibrio hydrothermalis AM13 = DSM 14728]
MTNRNNSIWINAGEASGDMHGAMLAKQLLKHDPDLKVIGMGGPDMEQAGCDIRYSMQLISLMGLTEVLPKLPRLLRLFGQIGDILKKERPKAIILIDCPDFNFRLVKIAHKLGIPVYYYITPQIWAWRQGRAKFLQKYVRKILCILPFEQQFFKDRGVDAKYVGHPLLDLIPLTELDAMEPDPDLIGILPGSRSKEISSLLPEFAKAAEKLASDFPHLKFSIARAPGVKEEKLRKFWPDHIPVTINQPENRYRLMRNSSLIMAASGTATLECALIGTPTLVAYKMAPLSAFLAKLIIKLKYASLANLIPDKLILPEYLLENATAENFYGQIKEWIEKPDSAQKVKDELKNLRKLIGEPGVAKRTADIIMQDLNNI